MFMSKKYLIRFDDISPNMDWEKWYAIEKEIIKLNIKPILGVIPENKDTKLMYDNKDKEYFWKKVQYWQSLDWTIALHGLHHVYETTDSGLLKLNNRSEFAGLPYQIQSQKIKEALNIFSEYKINTKVWMAPAHSFDKTTISVLKENHINIITDGFYFRPLKHLDMIWIPQQLWDFEKFIPSGIWTICYHHSNFSKKNIENFKKNINDNKDKIISLDTIINNSKIKKLSTIDACFSFLWKKKINILSLIFKYKAILTKKTS